jgi:hypothetical protein
MLITIALGTAVLGAFGALSMKFGAEDRPGFNERRPLA